MDISFDKYLENINNDIDKVLIEEAVAIANNGYYRAAYIMAWLSCVESLKRRFNEAGKRDHNAGRINKQIESLENSHKSVDSLIIDKAKEYGFITDIEHTKLSHIYNLRCVFAHPYNQKPNSEELHNAISNITEIVLSQPITFREGYINEILKKLTSEVTFLDDYAPAIESYVEDIALLIDKEKYAYLLLSYAKEIELTAIDPSRRIFFYRGVYFLRKFLDKINCNFYKHSDWHDFVSRYPRTAIHILSMPDLFIQIGSKAQSSLVCIILQECISTPSLLTYLEGLQNENVLTDRQSELFKAHINTHSGIEYLSRTGLSLSTLFEIIIEKLKTYNWNVQNPTIEFISGKDIQEIRNLDKNKQITLGRNILQVADGPSKHGSNFFDHIKDNSSEYPYYFLEGIVLEIFINEDNKIRFKRNKLRETIKIINSLPSKNQEKLIRNLCSALSRGSYKYTGEYEEILKSEDLADNKWASPILELIEEKYNSEEIVNA